MLHVVSTYSIEIRISGLREWKLKKAGQAKNEEKKFKVEITIHYQKILIFSPVLQI